MSHSAREADKWLFEAQAAGLGLGAGSAIAAAEEASERDSQTEDAEEGDEEEIGWARRGEQYTRDLGQTREEETDYEDGAGDGGTVETASVSVDDENDTVPFTGGTFESTQTSLSALPSVDSQLESPETRFHDAPQSPQALKTPTLPSIPSLPLLDSATPLQARSEGQSNFAPPPSTSAFAHSTDSEIPFRRDGKLSLPVYSDTPLGNSVPQRRNRSDGDGLNAEEQAELASRLNAFDLNQPLVSFLPATYRLIR
jgi:hypothetical protein